MSTIIKNLIAQDIRFPTSQGLHGSDAMNPDPDYSAVYITLETDKDELQGNGIVFTLGRGTDLCKAAVELLASQVVNKPMDMFTGHPAKFWRQLTSDSQLRWLGPDKGVVHLALGGLVNAFWDLWAKLENKPLWQLLSDMSSEQLVDCIDFRYITDALTPDEALEILRNAEPERRQFVDLASQQGMRAYTTSVGWLGYSDDMIRALCQESLDDGWTDFKIKVGADVEQDRHRLEIVRKAIGPDRRLMVDANQVWDVPEAIEYMRQLREFEPWWIEEPTSPDDALGHAAIRKAIRPIGVATGEMCQNRVLFKQMFQADAIDFCQVDSCRLGGVNEVIAVMLMSKKFGVPICCHGGGVGLCEHIQHLAVFDLVCISQSTENRVTEFVDHLHEHFVDPVRVQKGRYVLPNQPGYSIQMYSESLDKYAFPDGPVWQDIIGRVT